MNLDHRGACGCEINTGDGAGILMQMPHTFPERSLQEGAHRRCRSPASTAAAWCSCRAIRRCAGASRSASSRSCSPKARPSSAGAPCRPTTRCSATPRSRASRSCARCSSAATPTLADELAFERKLYVIRKRAYTEIRTSTLDGAEYWYIASLSYKTLVYKGMLTDRCSWRQYFPDLSDPADGDGAGAGALALQHQHVPELGSRASVPLHRAQRRDQHAARQHQLDARARGAVRSPTLFGDDIEKILPIINPNGSDSAMFDNTLELLVLAGRSLPHAMMMMIPEPWSNHETHGRRRSARSTNITRA